jgi:hypothetical protein
VDATARKSARTFDDLDTRGGPPIVKPPDSSLNVNVSSDSRKTWQLKFEADGFHDAEGGWDTTVNPQLQLQASPRLQLSLATSYRKARNIAQWIANRDVNGDGTIDNVYGTLRRNVLDMTARATYGFTRDTTLEVFLQPFVAAGDYTDIRRLARAKSFDFESATLPFNPDFNRKSLRGNIVMRWEYVRGSTLFFVWNISTLDTSRPGEFSPFRDLRGGFGADGTHVFMVKMTYWLGL